MTKNAHFPIDVQTYGMERTIESDDRVYSQNAMEKYLEFHTDII